MELLNHIKKIDKELNIYIGSSSKTKKKILEIPNYPLEDPENLKILEINPKPFKNIVLSGCGIRGFTYLGVFKALEQLNLTKNVEKVYGTSAGAIMGSLFVIGYTGDELLVFLKKSEFKKLKNPKLTNVIDKHGLDDGKNFLGTLIELYKKKGFSKNLTFQQLYQKTGKDLIITGTNLNKVCIEYFSRENTPKMKILNAVRISMSIPGYFTPVNLKTQTYVDGGLIDNFPMYQCIDCLDISFGVYISQDYKHLTKILNLEDYFGQVFHSFMKGFNEGLTKSFEKHVLKIDLPSINPFDFDISIEKIKEMQDIGYSKTINYFILQNHHPSSS